MEENVLNSEKRISNRVVAVAVAAAILVGVIVGAYLLYRKNFEKHLLEFQQETYKASEEFSSKYSNASDEGIVLGEIDKNETGLLSLNDIKVLLKEYPATYSEVIEREDIFSVMFGKIENGAPLLDQFVASYRLGKPCSLVIAQFTTNLDPIYYYLEYDGNKVHVVMDQTRDDYDEIYGYVESFGDYFRLDQFTLDNNIFEYAYLTDDENMSYLKVLYFINMNAMGHATEKPSDFFEFYVGTYPDDSMKERIIAIDRTDDTEKTKYSGFADLHPDFTDDNSMLDYDGDGLLDRVYREYDESSDASRVYLFFGNGKNVLMGEDIWGMYFSTIQGDFFGNGNNDICFLQYNKKAGEAEYGITLIQNDNGEYEKVICEEKYSHIEVISYNGQKAFLCSTVSEENEIILYYKEGLWVSENV